jgi:hypothetical protein
MTANIRGVAVCPHNIDTDAALMSLQPKLISIPVAPKSLLTVDCWLLTVEGGVKKMKIARIISCELDSTLRPTMKRGFDIIPAVRPELI